MSEEFVVSAPAKVLVAGGFGLQDRGSLFNMAEGSANQYEPG